MNTTTHTNTLKFKRVRAGYYETGNQVEGAYVISSDRPGSWIIHQWAINDLGLLEKTLVESCGSYAYAKHLADFDARISNTNNVTPGMCRLQHVTPGKMYSHPCGTGATHLVMHKAWGRGNVVECCQEKARELSDARAGYTIYAWDSLTSPAPIPAWVANYIANGGQA